MNTQGSAPLPNSGPRQKNNAPNERTDQSSRKKIQLSNEEIANLSDAQFKTLVIRMLTELVEFGHKLGEKMKAMLRETKKNVQGTNSDAKETGTQINGVDQKEGRNILLIFLNSCFFILFWLDVSFFFWSTPLI